MNINFFYENYEIIIHLILITFIIYCVWRLHKIKNEYIYSEIMEIKRNGREFEVFRNSKIIGKIPVLYVFLSKNNKKILTVNGEPTARLVNIGVKGFFVEDLKTKIIEHSYYSPPTANTIYSRGFPESFTYNSQKYMWIPYGMSVLSSNSGEWKDPITGLSWNIKNMGNNKWKIFGNNSEHIPDALVVYGITFIRLWRASTWFSVILGITLYFLLLSPILFLQ